MSVILRQSTAGQEVCLGPFLDSTDGDSEEVGLTIANTDILLHKTGATTLAAKNSGGATHISDGIYYTVLDATDTNTAGPLIIYCHMAGALFVKVPCLVYPAVIYDSFIAGTDYINVDVNADQSGVTVGTVNAVHADVVADVADGVCDEVLSGHSTADSLGLAIDNLLKIGKNKIAYSGTSLIIYDDDNTTPLYSFTLDSATAPTSRVPV